jgi:fructose transport system substrate-binding protein
VRIGLACAAALALCAAALGAQQPVIGLITKTETNPFFVRMKEGAQNAAKANGLTLMTGAGKNDGDNAGQVTALENMIVAGAKVIMITVNDSKAIVPAIRKARAKGVVVIAWTARRIRWMQPMRCTPRTTTEPGRSSASTRARR